jgi:hypothetical protein
MVETTTFAHMRPFSPAALACLPTRGSDGAWVADGQDSAAASVGPPRRDLRDLLIFSVDPPGCQDIDDALSARYVLYGSCPGGPCCLTCPSWVGGRVWSRGLASAPCQPLVSMMLCLQPLCPLPHLPNARALTCSARRLPNGNLQVGVHIADVTHFVRHNGALDIEARHVMASCVLTAPPPTTTPCFLPPSSWVVFFLRSPPLRQGSWHHRVPDRPSPGHVAGAAELQPVLPAVPYVPLSRGAVVPWCRGAVVPWCRGAVVPWCRGAVVPWCRGACHRFVALPVSR